jgi:hypothetical protein
LYYRYCRLLIESQKVEKQKLVEKLGKKYMFSSLPPRTKKSSRTKMYASGRSTAKLWVGL